MHFTKALAHKKCHSVAMKCVSGLGQTLVIMKIGCGSIYCSRLSSRRERSPEQVLQKRMWSSCSMPEFEKESDVSRVSSICWSWQNTVHMTLETSKKNDFHYGTLCVVRYSSVCVVHTIMCCEVQSA